MHEFENGFVINEKFELGDKQGQGSLGEDIYHGKHLELGREIIIRILPGNTLPDDECTQRFIQGIKLAAVLQHPNILRVLDAGEFDNIKFFVTNYEKGFFLNDYLDQRGQLDENESIRLIKGLADALDYAWNEQQIIHRNICPDTILIGRGNIPMLTDFALAKSLESDAKLTMQGYAVGNPTYMSPEQIKGEDVDYHSDIYCLGLVFYQVLAGHPPFRDEGQMELMQSQVSKPHAPIQGANEHVTDACAAVIDKMLEKNVADRYQTWDDVVADLDAIQNQKTPAALKKGSSKEVREKIKKDVEAKVGKKYQKAMTQVKNEISKDSRRRLKRNFIILAVIANIIVLALFIYYMKWKKEQAQKKSPNKPNTINLVE